VSRNVDRNNFLKSKIPFQTWVYERSYKSTTCGINMNDRIDVLLDQEIIDGLGVLIFTSVGTSEDNTDTNLSKSAAGSSSRQLKMS